MRITSHSDILDFNLQASDVHFSLDEASTEVSLKEDVLGIDMYSDDKVYSTVIVEPPKASFSLSEIPALRLNIDVAVDGASFSIGESICTFEMQRSTYPILSIIPYKCLFRLEKDDTPGRYVYLKVSPDAVWVGGVFNVESNTDWKIE